MGKADYWALLGLRLFSHLPSLVRAGGTDDGITATCNHDNTITVGLNYYVSSGRQILSATYGTCVLGDSGISGTSGTSSTGWSITLEPSRCSMESILRTLDYNHTAKFVVGKKDGDTELVTAKFEIDTYCSYTSEYTVTYGYNVVGDSFEFTDSGGLLGIAFVIESFKSDFSGTQTPSQQAGNMIYLGLYINATATPDFDHADSFSASSGKMFVPTQCTLNDGTYTYTLFDTANDAKCTNDVVELDVSYDSAKNMWEISHLLFLLNPSQGIPSGQITYSLSCKITVCDAADASSCLAAAACLGVVCLSPLKADSEGKCVPDWQKVSWALPSDWADKVKNAGSPQDYDDMFKANNGHFLSILAEGGTLEDLEHAVNLIKHVDLNVADYLEIVTAVANRKNNITPFLRAVLDLRAEGPKKLALLASLGANTAHKDSSGKNVLSYAATYGSAEMVQFILDQEYVRYADSQTTSGSDPLLSTTWDEYTSDQLEKIKILKAYNPTAASTRPDGFNLFMGIATSGSRETVKYVLDNFPFADNQTTDGNKRSAPYMVIYHRDPSIQADLLTMYFDYGFSASTISKNNYNLLHWFAQFTASKATIELLGGMAQRGDTTYTINTKTSYSNTPLTLVLYNRKLSATDRTAAYNYLVGKGATRSFTASDPSEDVADLPTE